VRSDYVGSRAIVFVSCAKGLEYLLVDELVTLGATRATAALAGAHAAGTLGVAQRAVLWSRLASRVPWPLCDFACPDQDALYTEVAKLPWWEHLRSEQTLAVDAHVSGTELTHERFAAQRVKGAVVDVLREKNRDPSRRRSGEPGSSTRSFPSARGTPRCRSIWVAARCTAAAGAKDKVRLRSKKTWPPPCCCAGNSPSCTRAVACCSIPCACLQKHKDCELAAGSFRDDFVRCKRKKASTMTTVRRASASSRRRRSPRRLHACLARAAP